MSTASKLKQSPQPKHTPGPWAHGKRTENYIGVANEYGAGVCRIDLHPGGISEANARLIAAAPEMIEALEGFILEFSAAGGKAPNMNALINLVHRAIMVRAKATGGAE